MSLPHPAKVWGNMVHSYFFIFLNLCYNKRFLCVYMLYNEFALVDLSFQKPMETSITLLKFFGFSLKSFGTTKELESSA